MLGHSLIIAGDFNWNINMDKNLNSTSRKTFSDVSNLLKQYNIHSMYHVYNDLDFGVESDPTLFLNYDEQKSYHIDYIFASADMKDQMRSFSVGKYADWRSDPCKSDHMPLMVEFEDIL